MIVTDLSKSFHPYPKDGVLEKVIEKKKNESKKEDKTDFCIMPKSKLYSTKRTKKYCERHEVYFSRAYRQKSIIDGLIVFLTEDDHRGTDGVHGKNGAKLNRKLKRLAKKAWIDYYHKTEEDFIKRYGKID